MARTLGDFFDEDEIESVIRAGMYIDEAGNVAQRDPAQQAPKDPVVTAVPTPIPQGPINPFGDLAPFGGSGIFRDPNLMDFLATQPDYTAITGDSPGLQGRDRTETGPYIPTIGPGVGGSPPFGQAGPIGTTGASVVPGALGVPSSTVPAGTTVEPGKALTEDQMSRIIARIWNGEQPHQFMAGAREDQVMRMVAAHTIYIDNQAAMQTAGYDATIFLNQQEDRVQALKEGKEKWAYEKVLNDLKIKKISLEMEQALLEAEQGRADRRATAQFRADQLANEATKLATERDRLNEQIRANLEAERLSEVQAIREANRFQAAQVREDVRAKQKETFDLSMFNLGADLQRDLATERSNLDIRLATEAADLRSELAQLGFDDAEATRISNTEIAKLDRDLQESLATKARALEDRKIALEKELRNRGYDEQAADRVSSETISRLDRASRERLAQLQSQTALQQSAIANPFGFGAFQALGGLPGQGGTAGQGGLLGQGGPADQGSNPLLSGLSELGFNIPEGTQAGTQMAPQEFFGGTIPNLGALQQLPPEALQTLMAILGLTGTGTEAFGRQAAGVTPTMQGPTARRLVTSPLTGRG
jgi:hypothetical protein